MTASDIRERTRAFIRESFLYMRPDYQFDDDQNLLAHGIIDSLGAVELLGFVQEEFAIAVADEEITEANFGSVRGITDFVTRRHCLAA